MNSTLQTHESILKQLHDINEFRKLFPQRFSDAPAPFHREMNDLLCKNPLRVAYAAPRGFGKSTGVTLLQSLYRIAYRMEKFIVVLTNRSDLSKRFIAQIREQLEHNEDYMTLYELELIKATAEELRVKYADGTYCTIIALGGGQDPRGLLSFDGYRPTLVILDDYEGQKDRSSEIVRDTKYDNFVSGIVPGVDPKIGKIWVIGTIVHEFSLLNLLLTDDGNGYEKKIYKAIMGGKSLWEARHPLAKLIDERDKAAKRSPKDLSIWAMEFMNEPVAEGATAFKENNMQFYDPEVIKRTLNKYLVLTAVDYAQTAKRTSDYTVVTTVAVDQRTANWYVLEMNYLKRDPTTEANAVLEAFTKYRPTRLGIEEAGAGISFIDNVTKTAISRGINMYIERLHPNKMNVVNKNARIVNYLQPKFHNCQVYFPKTRPEWFHLFRREYVNFVEDKDNRDDGLDTLAYIAFMEQSFGVGGRYYEVSSDYVTNNVEIDATYIF